VRPDAEFKRRAGEPPPAQTSGGVAPYQFMTSTVNSSLMRIA
jgi:hypothetical protein